MLISRSLKLIDNHANVSTPTIHRSVSMIDVSRAHLPSVKFAEPRKESKIPLRLPLAAYWLMFLAEVVLLAAEWLWRWELWLAMTAVDERGLQPRRCIWA
jgi:hypothetical protein